RPESPIPERSGNTIRPATAQARPGQCLNLANERKAVIISKQVYVFRRRLVIDPGIRPSRDIGCLSKGWAHLDFRRRIVCSCLSRGFAHLVRRSPETGAWLEWSGFGCARQRKR